MMGTTTTSTMSQGTTTMPIAPATRERLKNYKIQVAAANYTEAIERLINLAEEVEKEDKEAEKAEE